MKLIQFEPLFLRDFVTDIWPFPLHNHNHYELMLVNKGQGFHVLNGKRTRYSSNVVFFLVPEDVHDFIIEEETHFSVIKFLPSVLKDGINKNNTDYWDNFLTSLGSRVPLLPEFKIETTVIERIKAIIQVMVAEWRQNKERVTELHSNLLRALLLILEKCINDPAGSEIRNYGDTKINRIQNYIHSHISRPEKLSLEELSKLFGMSQSTMRLFFRKEMGVSLRDYINSLKLEHIKERMLNSSNSLSEIAENFGFTDSSHFYRFFIKHTGFSPKAFRKLNKEYFLNHNSSIHRID